MKIRVKDKKETRESWAGVLIFNLMCEGILTNMFINMKYIVE